MPYATEDEVKLATELGYSHQRSHRFGSKFQNSGDRRIWSIRMSESSSGFGWQTADLENGWYTNHKKFSDLSSALRRPL